jgi:hypothetical protein
MQTTPNPKANSLAERNAWRFCRIVERRIVTNSFDEQNKPIEFTPEWSFDVLASRKVPRQMPEAY